MRDYTYAKSGEVEIRVDFSRPETNIQYKVEDDEWESSPYQSADLNHLSTNGVLEKITEWLEGQY